MREPPSTPPCRAAGRVPGRLISNERATYMRGGFFGSRFGVGIVASIASMSASTPTRWLALMGTTGAEATGESFKNSVICR